MVNEKDSTLDRFIFSVTGVWGAAECEDAPTHSERCVNPGQGSKLTK